MSRLEQLCPYTHKQLIGAESAVSVSPSLATLQMELQRETDESPAEYKIANNGADYTLTVTKTTDLTALIVEDLVMRMASIAGLRVAPHSLISSSDGVALHIVDCTVRGRRKVRLPITKLTESLPSANGAYSCEQLAQSVMKLSTTPKLDCITLFETLYFNWFVGNISFGADGLRMVRSLDGYTSVAPVTSLSSSMLLDSTQAEEYRISINGKCREIKSADFVESMIACGLDRKIAENTVSKFNNFIDPWCDLIEESQLSEQRAEQFKFMLFLKS